VFLRGRQIRRAGQSVGRSRNSAYVPSEANLLTILTDRKSALPLRDVVARRVHARFPRLGDALAEVRIDGLLGVRRARAAAA
jgi:hypothetical protein